MSNHNQPLNTTELLLSLPDSELQAILLELPEAEQIATLKALLTGRSSAAVGGKSDMDRKREQRALMAGIREMPDPKDPARREACLADPERFLRTYGYRTFYTPFVSHHRAMIGAIYERAKTGGDKAVAGPRGEGKTQIATWMVIYVVLALLRRFPVVFASNGRAAKKIFTQIQRTFADSELLLEDFPEVCIPVLELDGAPQRAAKQHYRGKRTRIIWNSSEIGFPYIEGSPYGGTYLTSFGLDCAFRGFHINGVRPDFALIDDPETHEVALSWEQNHKIEELIDGDIALLGGPDTQLARVVLTSIQTRRSYSYRVTDRKLKPSWEGERYRALVQWPVRTEMWDEYIARRQQAQAAGDKDAAVATQWYLENIEAMSEGAEVSNPNRFAKRYNAEGELIEVDALQAFYNKVADLGMARVMAELQNDPEEDADAIDTTMGPGVVQKAVSELQRNQYPDGARVFAAIDVGKYRSHWVKIAMTGEAVGYVVDYGVAHTANDIDEQSERVAIERAILRMLLDWREEVMDGDHPPELCFVDSGAFTDGVYEFVRQAGGIPFVAAKGQPDTKVRFEGESKPGVVYYERCRADLQAAVGLWLYNFDSVHWKKQVQERFQIGAYAATDFTGSLRVWASESRMTHKSYSHHICAERWEERFIEGKGVVGKWQVKAKQNHWLDATAMALAASGVAGIRALPRTQAQPAPSVSSPGRLTMPDGRPFLVTERGRGRR